jgi:prepilin-type N-terminal cleavage/methylation domain-containing protein
MLRLATTPAPVTRVVCQLKAFTLIELMVVLVIVAMLASLTLAGLSGVRQRAKIDKTRSTIRKIDAVIQPMYESYATRRVPATGANPVARAMDRLRKIRVLMAVEMPDNWDDVGASSISAPSGPFGFANNSVFRRYQAFKAAINTVVPASDPRFDMYAQAETLMMILSVGAFEPSCMEQFRADEIGDIDRDGAKEFRDGWGRPIAFIRWPASFDSPFNDFSVPDSFDVMRVSGPPLPAPNNQLVTSRGLLIPPVPAPVSDWSLTPLIFSPGPDESLNDPLAGSASGYGLRSGVPWLTFVPPALPPLSICDSNDSGGVLPGAPAAEAVRDNISNYDVPVK